MRKLTAVIAIGCVAFGLVACTPGAEESNPQKSESGVQQGGYKRLVAGQPAHAMDYSPTRDTINAWVDTWNKKGQLSFVYLLNNDGAKIGYYVFQGPPVTYCAALTPTYRFVDPGGSDNNGDVQVPAPSVDGVYYSGGQCSEYIGKDATTGQILDFTAGVGLNFVSSTQPLYLDEPDIPALGVTEITDLKKVNGKYVK